MKKLLLALSASLVSVAGFAQDKVASPASNQIQLDPGVKQESGMDISNTANKASGLTPAIRFAVYTNQAAGPYSNYVADQIGSNIQPFDSGRLSGMNVYNWKGYAQYYPGAVVDRVSPADSTYQINGLIARFTGAKSASSTRNIVFNIWKRDASKVAVPGRTKWFIYGMPNNAPVASKSVPFSSIVNNNKGKDTGFTFVTFNAPLTGVNYNFYAGYTVAYTWGSTAGDTLGLSVADYVTGGTGSYGAEVEASTKDTLFTSYSVIQNAAGTWNSTLLGDGYSTNGALILFPVLQINCNKCGLSVPSMQNNILVSGTYPNPATNSANLKFSLVKGADITVSILDVTGRTVKTIKPGQMAPGTHDINMDLSGLSSGSYVCLMQTTGGDGVAIQMTVAK